MSLPDNGSGRNGVKTLAIRLEPEVHAQLTLVAQLRANTITDEIRTAIEAHLRAAKTAPDLAAQADSVLEAIEADAAARRDAIATLFDTTSDKQPPSRARAQKAAATKATATD